MTASRDPDRLIHAFLHEGLDELPDPVYDVVRDRIEQTRQRADFGLWRTSLMSNILKYGLTVAAGVLVVVIGNQLIGGSNPGGPAASETPQPSASSEPSAPTDASLPVGAYIMDITYGFNGDQVVLTIPAPGWTEGPDGWSVTKDLGGDDRVIVAVAPHDHYRVPADSCNWQNDRPGVSDSIDALVAAFTAQTHNTADGSRSRGYSTPEDVTIDGYSGVSITSAVPVDPNGDATGCDQQRFCSLLDRDGAGCLLSHLEPGAIDTIWILEFGEGFEIVAASFRPTTGPELLAEMNAIVDSLHNIVQ